MLLKTLLEQEHSKAQTEKIVGYIGSDKKRFKELMDVFLKGQHPLVQRAAWCMSYSAIAHPALIKPYLPLLIKKLQRNDEHPAVARNILRMWQDVELPELYCGPVLDRCLELMRSEMQPAAVRAFAITVAARICKRYPELIGELRLILEELQLYPQLPAVRHRIKLALKELRQA